MLKRRRWNWRVLVLFVAMLGIGLAEKFGQTMGGAAGVGAINGAIDGIFEQLERQIGLKVIFPAGDAIDRLQNGLTGNFGVYH